MTNMGIEAFLAICRHKNISKAADELYITQASLSARLKALEEELGCTLLLRGKGKRELTLTTQGQSFYTLALQYRDVMQKMNAVGYAAPSERLRVSAINSVGNYLLPAVLERFASEHPHIRLTVQDMEAELACLSIISGKTDIAFSTSKVETDQIVATPFMSEPFAVICAADAAFPAQVTREDLPLENEVYISWSAEYAFWRQTAFGSEEAAHIRLELMGQIGMFASMPGKWALVPCSVANHLCTYNGLRQCTPLFPIPQRSIYVLRHRDNAESPAILCFLDTLRDVLGQQKIGEFLL